MIQDCGSIEDFVPPWSIGDGKYGYCRQCFADMDQLPGDSNPRHLNSHMRAMRLGLWGNNKVICQTAKIPVRGGHKWKTFIETIRFLQALSEKLKMGSPTAIKLTDRDWGEIVQLKFGGIPSKESLSRYVSPRIQKAGLQSFQIFSEVGDAFFDARRRKKCVRLHCLWRQELGELECFVREHLTRGQPHAVAHRVVAT